MNILRRRMRISQELLDDVIAHERSVQSQAADLRVVPSDEGSATGEQIVQFGRRQILRHRMHDDGVERSVRQGRNLFR